MSARQLLDQLLQSGQGLLSEASARTRGAAGDKGSFLAGLGGGALGAGALGLLLGSKKARKIGGKVAMYGGMAALGALAYRAYADWQRNQAGAPGGEPQTLDRLPAPQAEQHSAAVLAAMIGAAKADGHIGPEERALLDTEMSKLSADARDRRWLEEELSRPLDPAQIARAAATPEMAAEMYLASLMVVDEESYMERAYLDELARQLKLDPGLKTRLEEHARAAA
ncbi:tellurite resistance TerB family protein [Achromobacter sp. Marseille-Q4962]|uniref:tellurite resistance TerB family protein n=1 Tax=Achromobacter sp. Marseille-Q4962 TaxID=2942202 RepID=UPI002073B8DC|nr:tellurite resistance TerB family protein [Achromobacter sp. Marseille-Q4962]